MKTATREKIIKIIRERGQVRPHDLATKLRISLQALHRHLKCLIEKGVLERRGGPPHTVYALVDVPEYKDVLAWAGSEKSAEEQDDWICGTRDVFTARLVRLKTLEKRGFPTEDIPILIAVAGEIGNNSFDHNLGKWRDAAGVWFEEKTTAGRLWICLADRGQGIFESLKQAAPELPDEQTAVETAFEKRISGRSPELRGNGLKFVKSVVTQSDHRGIACMSGTGRVRYGHLGEACLDVLRSGMDRARGTVTLLAWRIR